MVIDVVVVNRSQLQLYVVMTIHRAHRVEDKKAAAAKTEQNNNNILTFQKPPIKKRIARFWNKIMVAVWGNVDYTKAPTNRNFVDYTSSEYMIQLQFKSITHFRFDFRTDFPVRLAAVRVAVSVRIRVAVVAS